MSKLQDHVWESSKRDTRNSFRCTHWLCDTVNDVFGSGTVDVTSRITSVFSDASFVVARSDAKLAFEDYRWAYKIGSSGVVFGWMGMRLVTSVLSSFWIEFMGILSFSGDTGLFIQLDA